MKQTVGVDYIGLGLDCCDMLRKYFPPSDDEAFDILKHQNLQDLTKKLLERDFEKEEIMKIYGGNWLKVYGKVFKLKIPTAQNAIGIFLYLYLCLSFLPRISRLPDRKQYRQNGKH